MTRIFRVYLFLAVLLSAPVAIAQTIFVSTAGDDANPGTSAQPKRTIQAAFNIAATGQTIQVLPGTYNEYLFLARKAGITIVGAATPAAAKPVISRLTGQANALIAIDACPNFTFRGFEIQTDLTLMLNALTTIGNCDNLRFDNLLVNPTASDTLNIQGGPTSPRHGFLIDGSNASIFPAISITNCTINAVVGRTLNSSFFFNRGILIRGTKGIIGGPAPTDANTITAQRDILSQFVGGGITTIENNNLTGGGIDITLPQSTGDVRISNNRFNVTRAVPFLIPEIILLKHNANNAPILLTGNTITGHTRTAVRAAGARNTIVRGNTFTPNDSALNYRHIEVNTLWEGTTQLPTGPNSIRILGNTFRHAATTTAGVAIFLKNERKGVTSPDFSEVLIGGAGGDANLFDQRIRKYIVLDPTRFRTFNLNLDLSANQFNISGTPELPIVMSQANLLDLEDKIDHAIDEDSVGLVRVKPNELYITPRSYFRPYTFSAAFKRAIRNSGQGHVINIRDSTYSGLARVDKDLVFSPSGAQTIIDSLLMATATATDELRITSSLSISNALNFSLGKLRLGNNSLSVINTSSQNPGAGNDFSYVLTDGTGKHLNNNVIAQEILYPIGPVLGYRPVLASNNGLSDNLGLRVQPDVLSQATTGTSVDTVVGLTWFAEEATPGAGSYNLTPLWFRQDQKPLFDSSRIQLQAFVANRWTTISGVSFLPRLGTNPFTVVASALTLPFSNTPLRLYGSPILPDTIFYVDNVTGIDNVALRDGRSPEQAWASINFAVTNSTRVAPSGRIWIRVKPNALPYTDAVNIQKSRVSIRGGFTGAEGAAQVVSLTGTTSIFNIEADSVWLDKFDLLADLSITDDAIKGNGDINQLLLDSLSIRSNGTKATSRAIALTGIAATPSFVSVTSSSILASATSTFGTGIYTDFMNGQLGRPGNRRLFIASNRDIDSRNGFGGSLEIKGNTLNGGGSIVSNHTGQVTVRGNRIARNGSGFNPVNPTELLLVERITDGSASAFIDSNVIIGYTSTGLYVGNVRQSNILANTFTPDLSSTAFTHLLINSSFPTAATVTSTYATNNATINANRFLRATSEGGVALALVDAAKTFINPGFNNVQVGGPAAAQNTFSEGLAKYIQLSAQSGQEFYQNVDARENLFGVSGTVKVPLAMSQTELFTVEDRIDHKIDVDTLGLVRLRPTQLYITPNSFVAPVTTQPSLQRAVKAATVNEEVNIQDATYFGAVTIPKSLTFLSSGDLTQTPSVEMNGAGATLTIQRNLTLSDGLSFVDGKMLIDDNSIIMLQPATSPSGGNAGSYLVTSGNGTLNIQGVGPGTKDSVLYPIGTSASWLPMRIRNTGQADELRLRVLPDNLSQGFTGSPEDSVVTATWVLTEATAGGSTLTITPQWNESDEKPTFDRSRSIVQYYQAGWKFFGPRILTQASGNNPYFVTNSSLTGVSFNQTPLRVYGYLPPNIVFLPKLFSPNADGANDNLLIYSNVIGQISIKIYNRWGNLVYETSDVIEATTKGWDGTHKGQAANTDSYIWQVTGSFVDGRPITIDGKNTGVVILAR